MRMSVFVILGLLCGVAKAVPQCDVNLCKDCLADGIYGMQNGPAVWTTDGVGKPGHRLCESSSHKERDLDWGFGAYRGGALFSVVQLGNPGFECMDLQGAHSSSQTLAMESNGTARLLHSRSNSAVADSAGKWHCSSNLCDEMWEDGYYALWRRADLVYLYHKKLGATEWTPKCWASKFTDGQFMLHRINNGEARLGVGQWSEGWLYNFEALSCPAVGGNCDKDLCREIIYDGVYGFGGHGPLSMDFYHMSNNHQLSHCSAYPSTPLSSGDFGVYVDGEEFKLIQLGLSPSSGCPLLAPPSSAPSSISSMQMMAKGSDEVSLHSSSRPCKPDLCYEMREPGVYTIPSKHILPLLGLWRRALNSTAWQEVCRFWQPGSVAALPMPRFVMNYSSSTGSSRPGLLLGPWTASAQVHPLTYGSCPITHSEQRRLDVAESRRTAQSSTVPLQQSSVFV